MDSGMKTPRFTVLNNAENDENIYISKTLLNQISQQQKQQHSQQQQQQQNGGSASESHQSGSAKQSDFDSNHPQSKTNFASSDRFNAENLDAKNSSSEPSSSSSSSSSFGDFENLSNKKFNQNFSQRKMASPIIDPEYIARHAQFDASTHLFALRGEYERKLQQYQQVWRERFDDLERMNESLFTRSADRFAAQIAQIDERYLRTTHSRYEQPCAEQETAVTQCYARNATNGRPLECAHLVRQFSACVDKRRVNMLQEDDKQ